MTILKFLAFILALCILWAWVGPLGVIALCAATIAVWLWSRTRAASARNRHESRIEENLWRARWARQRNERLRLEARLAAREENAAYKATAMEPGLERLEKLR